MYINLISDDTFVVAESCCADRLVHAYIGHRLCGPMLQYTAGGNGLYNGEDDIDFDGGAWTPIYSRGDFRRNYACGGHWSGHAKNLHTRLKYSPCVDIHTELLVVNDTIMELPEGMSGDIHCTDIDCSGGWAIFYHTAFDAVHNMLRPYEISASSLPPISKKHLTTNYTTAVYKKLVDKIEGTLLK